MKPHLDYRRSMLADVLMELIEDPSYEPSEVSDAIMDELRDIHEYHAKLAEKAAKVISYLGG